MYTFSIEYGPEYIIYAILYYYDNINIFHTIMKSFKQKF